ncbi:N-acetylmuramoyl-L-alanine amidase [Tropicibacter sp. Alg240-R139]|uniref:N-acetylmuramoyl-L-alanine amidase n=1 Tax=Tropicibacter sp. Alg240-R139 TaxID=2305991 RepID=UPI0013DF5CF5|nr:N-acetylmuramoyl-L-alanine amidase [Tropicibacter sp. Alg240-R139]
MSRILTSIALIGWMAGAGLAQEFSGLARIDPDQSSVSDEGRKGVAVTLELSQGVPYRLFTLSEPPRLVMDFKEVDWTGLTQDAFVQTDLISQVQFGTYVPGWSRLVLNLSSPMEVSQAGLRINQTTGSARLEVELSPVSGDVFAAQAGAPSDARWDLPDPAEIAAPPERAEDAPLRVVLDPGHGGIDPGAESGAVTEKHLMLTFARELEELLLRTGGFEVALTRNNDYFVSLEQRIALAHRAGADVFISLHADSLAEGLAHGATVHVLSAEASDIASAKLAERQDRADLLSGVDLSETDDQVTDVLLDLARTETQPRTNTLARALVEGMAQQGGPMNRRPLRSAAFSVLKAADIPSVLIEIGFLSSPRDLKNLQNPEWRLSMAEGIRNGLVNWRKQDLENKDLVRQ